MEKLKKLVNDLFPSIICVVETWLNNAIPTAAINISTYNCYRLDYNSENPSGGLVLYIHKSVNSSLVVLDDVKLSQGVEYLIVSIQANNNRKFFLGLLYNHPSVNFDMFDSNCTLIEKMLSKGKNFYLCGDFNINLLPGAKKNNISRKFNSFLNRLNLSQIVNFPTRICQVDSTVTQSIIDLFITNANESVLEVKPNVNLQMADHRDLIITLWMNVKVPKKSFMHTFRDKSNYSKSSFCNSLIGSGITKSATCTDNINYATEIFNQCFMSILNDACPLKTIKCKYDFGLKSNPQLESAFKHKGLLLKKLSKTPEKIELSTDLNKTNKLIDKLLSDAKKSHFDEKFSKLKSNPKKLWSCINDVVPLSSKNAPFPINNITPPLISGFNLHFNIMGENVFNEVRLICTEFPAFLHGKTNFPQLELKTVEVLDVIKIVNNLKPSNSLTSDGIPLQFMKDSMDVIAVSLTQLINLSIVTNTVPSTWKKAILTPVHKKGDYKIENFRPISILPNPSKPGERVVTDQLIFHCEKYKIFNPHQFGYRKSSNTSLAVAHITEDIFLNLNNHRIGLLVLLDLSSAFDSIPHERLIQVLQYYNLYVPWFGDYLNGRTHCTKIDSHFSEYLPVKFGVPQGSILGPILFILYINEIKQFSSKFHHPKIKYKIINYADDTQILFSSEFCDFNELKSFATTVTDEVISFFYSLMLKINVTKTVVTMFATKTQLSKIPDDEKSVLINGTNITFSSEVKTLGVTLDSEMNFKPHINKLYRKVFYKLYYINKVRNTLNFQSRKLIVEHCAFSHLNYCREIWGNLSYAQNTLLQKLISFGAKIVFLKSKRDHSSELIKSLGFFTSEMSNVYYLSCSAFKCIKDLNNRNIPEIFNLNYSKSITRNQVILPKPKNSYMYSTILFRSSKLWLQIPEDLKTQKTFRNFKKSFKQQLLDKGDFIKL